MAYPALMEAHNEGESVINRPHLFNRDATDGFARPSYVNRRKLLHQYLRFIASNCYQGTKVCLQRAPRCWSYQDRGKRCERVRLQYYAESETLLFTSVALWRN